MVDTILGEFVSDEDTMATKRKHVREVEVATIQMFCPKYLDQLDIMFTKHDVKGLHFSHDNALIVKLTIAKCFVKKILTDTGNSIEKITMYLLRFNGEPSAVIGMVVMSISMRGKIVYSTMLVVDTDSTYNKILRRLWLSKKREVISTFDQMIKFPNENMVETLRSDKRVALLCYVEATKKNSHPDNKQRASRS